MAEGPDERFLKGRLLVATPDLEGTYFSQSVIYMIDHDETGAFGLVINKSLGILQVKPLFEKLGFDAEDAEGEVLARIGGPVEPGIAFILHSSEVEAPGSRDVGSGLSLTTEPGILKTIGKGSGPEHYIFAFGYTGWGPGQLEGEIARGSWIDVPAARELIFTEDDAVKWQDANEMFEFAL